MFASCKLLNHSEPATLQSSSLGRCEVYAVAFVKSLIQCPVPSTSQVPKEDTWDFQKLCFCHPICSSGTFRGSLWYRGKLGPCVLWADLAHRCMVHIEIFKNWTWLSMYKNGESSHSNLDFWLEKLKIQVTLSIYFCLLPGYRSAAEPLLEGACVRQFIIVSPPHSFFCSCFGEVYRTSN